MQHRTLILSFSATFIALIAAGSWIAIPFFPVPLTLQTLFVLLSGVVMKRYAVIPAGLYVLLGAMNLPVFHNGTAGIGVLFGPTGGFLIGFIPAALVCGLCYESRREGYHLSGLVLAIGLIFSSGVLWLSCSAGIPLAQSILLGAVPFIPGDAIKIAAAYTIGKRVI